MASQAQPSQAQPRQPGPVGQAAAGGEVVEVDAHAETVGCDGGGGALGHPLVYYSFGTRERVVCQYCGKVFARAGH